MAAKFEFKMFQFGHGIHVFGCNKNIPHFGLTANNYFHRTPMRKLAGELTSSRVVVRVDCGSWYVANP